MANPVDENNSEKKKDEPSCKDNRRESDPRDENPGDDTPETDEQFFFSRRRGFSTLTKACIGLGVGVAGAGAAVAAAPLVLAGAGFTSGGVAAGSLAASYMSATGPIVAGSWFAALQSAGAAGMGLFGTAATGAAGGGTAGLLSGLSSKFFSQEISIDELKATFVKHDTDMDNQISFLELQEALNSLRVSPSNEEIMKVYKTATGNVELVPVSLDTFLYMFGIKSEETEEEGYTPSRLNRIFEKYDSDKDGNLSYQELVAALNELEVNFDSADIENSYKSATGRSKLGSINREEFFKIFDLDVKKTA